jgi:two-component system, chemotaxis family, chemotaxis protein CheY
MPVEGEGGIARGVLLVEDSENSAAMMEIAFSTIPRVSLVLATSASDAWRMLRNGAAFQAIVTDLNMPRMDGFELIRLVRQDRQLASTPIIVVSGDTDPATPARIAKLGVDAYFRKPFSPAQLCRKLEQILDGNPTSQ